MITSLLLAVSTLGVNVGSVHSEPGYNNANPGVYALTASGAGAGVYLNSHKRTSVWAGYRFESRPAGPFKASLLLGGVTGYGATVTPMLSPSVSATLDAYTVRLSYLPRHPTKANSSDALHLSLEIRLPKL